MPSRGRVVKVKDFGGEESAPKKKVSAKKKVANNNVIELVKQYRVIDTQMKELDNRKKALRTAIMELSMKDAQEDAQGNKYAKYDNYNVKHEVRKSIKLRNFDEVPEDFFRDFGLHPNDVTTEVVVLDESKIEQLIQEDRISAEDAEAFLLKISTSTALKITEEKDDEVESE